MLTNALAINAIEGELDATVAYCLAEEIGIEVTAFAFPKNLDNDYDDRKKRHREAVSGLRVVSLHGPFLDLYPASPDARVVETARHRHKQGLNAASAVGASIYVAHTGYVSLIRKASYRERFIDAMAEFWVPLAEKAAPVGITIVLENLWDPDPDIQRAIIDRAGHPAIKASFDNGHALIFSDVPSSTWIETLGADLAHCHLHDNDGKYDDHDTIGDGVEDWPQLLDALRRFGGHALLVMESDELQANRASLERLKELMSGDS